MCIRDRVSTEYWMWLDADDIVPAESITAILKLKETLSKSPQPDVVMMKYVAGFQPDGTSAFTYNRERILRTDRHFRWKGRVHEAIAPRGRILYSPCLLYTSSSLRTCASFIILIIRSASLYKFYHFFQVYHKSFYFAIQNKPIQYI